MNSPRIAPSSLSSPSPLPAPTSGRAAGGAFQRSLQRASSPTAPTPSSPAHAEALELLALQQASNLQYLALQQKLSTPHHSVISNVLKVRHETAKNAIGNLR